MADEKSLTAQFVDLQFYLVDHPQVRLKGYKFKERVADLEQQLAQAHHDLEMMEEDLQNKDHHLAQARDLVGRLYAAFSLDIWNEAQEKACEEAEAFLKK